jgi:hypothetical protein
VKRFLIAVAVLASMWPCGGVSASAQSMDDLNLQVHGYATQGFVYSTNNNWNTTDSTDGSSAWTEAVVNLSVQPESKLRIGVQTRYFLLGDYGNVITLDWAQGDYKVNEKFGFRAGKVKTPTGLLNETQDIDPAQLWILLPQSIYPLASRSSILAHYGGVAYGAIPLGESLGRLDYRVYGGLRVIGPDDGYFETFKNAGLTVPSPVKIPLFGATLTWRTPIRGLVAGASDCREHPTGVIDAGAYSGTFDTAPFTIPDFFARYESKRIMLGGEYSRLALKSQLQFPGVPVSNNLIDQRAFYAMASYKLASRLTGGLYYSSSINKEAAFTSARYQKDWAITSRYDFNPYLYLKLEQHFIDGTELGYNMADNAVGLKPSTRMTLLKLGVSF